MSIHPIDFQGSIVNLHRAEKIQSNDQEHNLAIQSHISQEVKKQVEQQKKQVISSQKTSPSTIRDKKKERDNRKGKKKKIQVYTFKKKAEQIDKEGENLDVEV